MEINGTMQSELQQAIVDRIKILKVTIYGEFDPVLKKAYQEKLFTCQKLWFLFDQDRIHIRQGAESKRNWIKKSKELLKGKLAFGN